MVDATQQPAKPFAWHSLAPSWPLIAAIAAFLKSLACGSLLLGDPDTWMHIAAGNWMLAHHALPAQDPFSHTMPGAPWVVHEWLAELIMALTYDGFGWWGLVFLAASSFALTVALLTRWLMQRMMPMLMLLMMTLSFVMLLPHLLARPHMLADPVLVLWCAGLIGARDAGRTPSLLLLPLMTLWANLHAGFMVGVALAGFLGGEAVFMATSKAERWAAARGWGLFTMLALLASAITANGIGGLLLPLSFMGDKSVMHSYIIEWSSANFDYFGPLELWIMLLIGAGWGLGLKLPLPRLALVLGFTHLALAHIRYIDLIAMVAPLAIAVPLDAQFRALIAQQPISPLWQRLGALTRPTEPPGLAAAFVVMLGIFALCASTPIVRADSSTSPGAALAAAERLHLEGPVFNAFSFGGFLIYHDVKTFIDGRMEVYGEEFLSRYIAASNGEEPALDETLEHYGITWTLLHPNDGAVRVLDHLPGWQRVYSDEFAVIHARVAAD